MTIVFVSKSGNELKMKCDDITFVRNQSTGRVISWEATGIKENKPIDMDMNSIEFIYRVMSDED